MSYWGSLSASLHMLSLCFPCSMHSSGLSFQQECLLTGLLSNYSIALFIISWNSLMNSSQSALWLTSDKLSLLLVSFWSFVWSWDGLSAASRCCTFPLQLLDSPITSHLSSDRCQGACSCMFGGVSSTHCGACSCVFGGVSSCWGTYANMHICTRSIQIYFWIFFDFILLSHSFHCLHTVTIFLRFFSIFVVVLFTSKACHFDMALLFASI